MENLVEIPVALQVSFHHGGHPSLGVSFHQVGEVVHPSSPEVSFHHGGQGLAIKVGHPFSGGQFHQGGQAVEMVHPSLEV